MAKKPSHIIYFLVLCLCLPLFLSFFTKFFSFLSLFLFYCANGLLTLVLFKQNSKRLNLCGHFKEDLQEKVNIVKNEHAREQESKISLQEKIKRYNSLKEIIEDINRNLSLVSIADNLAAIAFSIIADNKGACILYLIDPQTQKLSLFKTKKEDRKLVVKEKQGDLFDWWVLRHSSPLLVEDMHNDFRFDLEKVKMKDAREVSSLVSAPFVSEHKFLGILRLDNSRSNYYSQDDLRFLVAICDLGAVALENGELYLKTEDLAIHDGLTGLYRKGYFMERLNEEVKRCLRQNSTFSLLMLDVDYFKQYNDTFGHASGDLVLTKMSEVMKDFFKEKSSVAGRFGGEEFCVIISGADKQKAFSLAEELRKKIESTQVDLRQQKTSVTVSVGVANFPNDARDETELVLKVDKALYEAKRLGRNRVNG
ncbi:MAG: sensor domain-containing diguanylate cyclase [Candidatus Omnitrophota bacterium]